VRIFEIVNPEDQLALWKLINTSVWQSIEQQVRDQQKRQAAQAVKKKRPKLKGGKKGGARFPKFNQPKTVPQPTAVPTPKQAANKPLSQTTPPAQPSSKPATAIAAEPYPANVPPEAASEPAPAQPKPLNRVKTAGLRLKNQLPVKPRTTV
jgi:hypothetical protein